ncbi:hypothetical protein [Paludisphaera rhizosphaerae]|uniref:hypothetical protein n=2 Tax=Paludisphaera rhizosphaerae TaxID=2711216 RepID=UPI0013EB97D4|nr:hypothetical protein [Paludisphaera rhizosphaerae]
MGSMRSGSRRSATARRSRFRAIETLETRQLMASNIASYLSPYIPTDLYVRNPETGQKESVSAASLYTHHNVNGALVSNEGKIVTGKDRAGDEWTITVHGPGKVIVTDTTPNDGALDDDIDTIQIVGSNINSTYVTGSTSASVRTLTDGLVNFNRLIATSGVKSVQLNGFDLTNQVSPAVSSTTGIYLLGGARSLEFHDIVGLFDTANGATPIQIQIGQANYPSNVKTSIYLDSIYNSVFDSNSTTIPTDPITSPWVQFTVNGVLQNFSIVSTTQSAVSPNYVEASQQGTVDVWTGVPVSGPAPAAYQFFYNVVGTTGRTSVQTVSVGNLKVRGSAKNFTVQRDTTPFTSSTSGVKSIRNADFGGTADGVALDVQGTIGRLRFRRGLGDSKGVFTSSTQTPSTDQNSETQTVLLPATKYGYPLGSTGYAADGLVSGAIRARRIGSLKATAANVSYVTAQNPDYVSLRGGGTPTVTSTFGDAITNSSITTTGSIGSVSVDGNLINSNVASGYDYQAHLQGLSTLRQPSRIRSYRQRGSLINSQVTASTTLNTNGSVTSADIGNGSITGHVDGNAYSTGGRSALGTYGAGVIARRKVGRLPVG